MSNVTECDRYIAEQKAMIAELSAEIGEICVALEHDRKNQANWQLLKSKVDSKRSLVKDILKSIKLL